MTNHIFSIPLLIWRISFSSLSILTSNIRSLLSSVSTCTFISISCLVQVAKCINLWGMKTISQCSKNLLLGAPIDHCRGQAPHCLTTRTMTKKGRKWRERAREGELGCHDLKRKEHYETLDLITLLPLASKPGLSTCPRVEQARTARPRKKRI